jgi:hypothetical protein
MVPACPIERFNGAALPDQRGITQVEAPPPGRGCHRCPDNMYNYLVQETKMVKRSNPAPFCEMTNIGWLMKLGVPFEPVFALLNLYPSNDYYLYYWAAVIPAVQQL